MTDYNDGEWHLWNGSFDCPKGVHPKSLISYVWHNARTGKYGMEEDWLAGMVVWRCALKFRVTKPHREPRVIWVNEYPDGSCVHSTEENARKFVGVGVTRVAVRYVEAPE